MPDATAIAAAQVRFETEVQAVLTSDFTNSGVAALTSTLGQNVQGFVTESVALAERRLLGVADDVRNLYHDIGELASGKAAAVKTLERFIDRSAKIAVDGSVDLFAQNAASLALDRDLCSTTLDCGSATNQLLADTMIKLNDELATRLAAEIRAGGSYTNAISDIVAQKTAIAQQTIDNMWWEEALGGGRRLTASAPRRQLPHYTDFGGKAVSDSVGVLLDTVSQAIDSVIAARNQGFLSLIVNAGFLAAIVPAATAVAAANTADNVAAYTTQTSVLDLMASQLSCASGASGLTSQPMSDCSGLTNFAANLNGALALAGTEIQSKLLNVPADAAVRLVTAYARRGTSTTDVPAAAEEGLIGTETGR